MRKMVNIPLQRDATFAFGQGGPSLLRVCAWLRLPQTPTMSTGSPAGTPTGGASRRQSNRRSSVNAAARAASANERARLQASLDQLHQDNEALQSEVDQLRQRTQPAQAPVLDDGVFAQEMIDKLLSKLDDNALYVLGFLSVRTPASV